MPFLEECTTHRSEALRVARPEAVGLARTNSPVWTCLKPEPVREHQRASWIDLLPRADEELRRLGRVDILRERSY
jgi:hypothetical protein